MTLPYSRSLSARREDAAALRRFGQRCDVGQFLAEFLIADRLVVDEVVPSLSIAIWIGFTSWSSALARLREGRPNARNHQRRGYHEDDQQHQHDVDQRVTLISAIGARRERHGRGWAGTAPIAQASASSSRLNVGVKPIGKAAEAGFEPVETGLSRL